MSNYNLKKVIKELSTILHLDACLEVVKKIDTIFNESDNYGNSYFKFLHYLFGQYGLVILEQDNIAFKKLFSDVIEKELFLNIVKNSIHNELNFIDENYKVQAKPRDINLFYMKGDIRERIIEKNGQFFVNNSSISFSSESLSNELELHPERFSPNVLLRPLYQESILPNLAYIGGGGEVAYWLQLKSLFDSQQINFPMLLLRDMGLIIDTKTNKIISKIDFDKKCLFFDKSYLISKLVSNASSNDLSIENELDTLENMYIDLLKKASFIDKSLESLVLSEENKSKKILQNIASKMLKAEKRNNDVLVARINTIYEKLFPSRKLQERHDNFLPYFIKYGTSFFDVLIENFNPLEVSFKFIIEET